MTPRPRARSASQAATYDVLMRLRDLSGREQLRAARARVDRAQCPEDLRAALLDESAICLKRMERLPMPAAGAADPPFSDPSTGLPMQ